MSSNISAIRSAATEGKQERKIKASMPLSEQIATLEHLIHNSPTNSRVIEFSPKLAEHVLENLSGKNRKRKPTKIKEYVNSLQSGAWGLTGDTIKFGDDFKLKDGQNRLSASVRSNKPLLTHVVFGIDSQLFDRMDIGKNRSGADVFTITGVSYANHVAAAVRWLLIFTSKDPGNRGAQFTNEELLKAYQDGIDADRLEQSIQAALAVRKTMGHPVGPLAALHYVFAKRDQHKADAFFDEWATGRAKGARAPSRYLQRMLAAKLAAANNRIHENVRNALIIKAWNAYVEGHSATKAGMEHAVSDPMPKIKG